MHRFYPSLRTKEAIKENDVSILEKPLDLSLKRQANRDSINKTEKESSSQPY